MNYCVLFTSNKYSSLKSLKKLLAALKLFTKCPLASLWDQLYSVNELLCILEAHTDCNAIQVNISMVHSDWTYHVRKI